MWRTSPIKSETNVAGAGPFGAAGVEGREGGIEMLDVIATRVLAVAYTQRTLPTRYPE